MTFVHQLEVRFRDCDPMGHTNNAVYLTYLEQADLLLRDGVAYGRGRPLKVFPDPARWFIEMLAEELRRLPVRAVCAESGVEVSEIDLLVVAEPACGRASAVLRGAGALEQSGSREDRGRHPEVHLSPGPAGLVGLEGNCHRSADPGTEDERDDGPQSTQSPHPRQPPGKQPHAQRTRPDERTQTSTAARDPAVERPVAVLAPPPAPPSMGRARPPIPTLVELAGAPPTCPRCGRPRPRSTRAGTGRWPRPCRTPRRSRTPFW